MLRAAPILSPEGDAKILNVNNPMDSNADLGTSVVSLLNKTPTIVEKIKSIFKKNKKEAEKEQEVEELDLSDIIDTPADEAPVKEAEPEEKEETEEKSE